MGASTSSLGSLFKGFHLFRKNNFNQLICPVNFFENKLFHIKRAVDQLSTEKMNILTAKMNDFLLLRVIKMLKQIFLFYFQQSFHKKHSSKQFKVSEKHSYSCSLS